MSYKIETKDVHLNYGDFHALKGISIGMEANTVTALIGPSGCGKSTYLRLFNRMNDLIEGVSIKGEVLIDGKSIYKIKPSEVDRLRRNVGMVFQKPNPFPKSIFENVAYGLRVNGITNKSIIDDQVEKTLQQALWDEVKDKLKKSAFELSGGQQQRLCIARALAIEPSILLMDEPASALDPISTGKIEDLIFELKNQYTIVIVPHNMQQAGRVSDYTAFFYLGNLVEYDKTKKIFTKPSQQQTENYITGRFG